MAWQHTIAKFFDFIFGKVYFDSDQLQQSDLVSW